MTITFEGAGNGRGTKASTSRTGKKRVRKGLYSEEKAKPMPRLPSGVTFPKAPRYDVNGVIKNFDQSMSSIPGVSFKRITRQDPVMHNGKRVPQRLIPKEGVTMGFFNPRAYRQERWITVQVARINNKFANNPQARSEALRKFYTISEMPSNDYSKPYKI